MKVWAVDDHSHHDVNGTPMGSWSCRGEFHGYLSVRMSPFSSYYGFVFGDLVAWRSQVGGFRATRHTTLSGKSNDCEKAGVSVLSQGAAAKDITEARKLLILS